MVHLDIDYSNLGELGLGGMVGLEGCQVSKFPARVKALKDRPRPVRVKVPPPMESGRKEPEYMKVHAVASNPYYVAYNDISPYVVKALLTTEDAKFWSHEGFATHVFESAVRKNLAGGGFRVGASSITMQMVKNLLLSQEKTISRKLQEMFLVWVVENFLSKERILELYLNGIEFGPRIYGVGHAAAHYFGKHASELTPLEASFFSTMLPSPKRRYIQYCRGKLSRQWQRYVRRILKRSLEKGHLTQEEYDANKDAPFVFDTSALGGKSAQCKKWVEDMVSVIEAMKDQNRVEAEMADDGKGTVKMTGIDGDRPDLRPSSSYRKGGARFASGSGVDVGQVTNRGVKKSPPGGFFRWVKRLVVFGLVVALVGMGVLIGLFVHYGRDPAMPQIERIEDYQPKQVYRVFARDGTPLAAFGTEKRRLVSIDDIPKVMVDATLAAEDANFFEHQGVDYIGIVRATVGRVIQGRAPQGASTITQQVVKLLLLTPARTVKRKVQEIILARRISNALSKREILEIYLNEINYGHGRYGCAEAARFYFGKPLADLSPAEAAMLAGIPKTLGISRPMSIPLRSRPVNGTFWGGWRTSVL